MANIDENNLITITDEFGNDKEYTILFTFYSEDFEKNYIFYYDAESDEDTEVLVKSSTGDELEGNLEDIQSDEEWEMVEEVFNTFVEEDEE